jgi:hypothetical protein
MGAVTGRERLTWLYGRGIPTSPRWYQHQYYTTSPEIFKIERQKISHQEKNDSLRYITCMTTCSQQDRRTHISEPPLSSDHAQLSTISNLTPPSSSPPGPSGVSPTAIFAPLCSFTTNPNVSSIYFQPQSFVSPIRYAKASMSTWFREPVLQTERRT